MKLQQRAIADASAMIGAEFGWPVRLRDPGGSETFFNAVINDVAQAIDPQTGVPVAGRTISATFSMADLQNVLVEGDEFSFAVLTRDPVQVSDTELKPWLVSFKDTLGHDLTFKIKEVLPDRTLGLLVCLLDFYKP